MELELISHKHPLVFKEVQKNDGARIICNGCRKRVWGSHYSCKECNFDLHKSCAEQPRELKHPLHPKHPLTLFQGVWSWGKCGACNGELWGFSYHCSHCEFKLHFKCAVLSLSLEAESHDHPFTLVRKSLSFTCDACGKEGKGMFYLCAICPILVHLECAPLPLTVRHIRHKHPLSLAYVNQSDHPWICQLCVEKVDTNYRVYCCSNCHFVAHLNCATHNERFLRDEEPIESTPIPENSELDESIDSLLSYVVKKIELGEDKIEKAVQIKHFSHEHDLELTDELETNEKCDACTRKIFSPFYSCAQCSFFLHKSCAELPRKKQHPLHQHPLILLPQAPYSGGFFQCLACDMLCNGFTYYCDKCHFNLDVQCGLLSDSFILDGHEHQLILSSTSNYYKCSSCDHHGSIFRCVDCEFTLDYVCATLPPTVRYKPYERFFTLCYSTAEDSDGEYYCDICEEERDPTHWFYYCGDLSFPAHPRCILGNYPYMKFGRTYTFDIHPHPLTCVQRTKEHTPCDGCDGSVSYAGLAFECAKCDFNLDEWCLREMVEGPSQL